MPATAGEASRDALGDSSDDAAHTQSAAGSLEGSIKIVRSTMPLRIEPGRLLALDDRALHSQRKCAGKASCPACALSAALFDAQRDCAGIAGLVARHLELVDGEAWRQAKLAAAGSKPEIPKPWPSQKYNAYQDARTAFPGVLSGIAASVCKSVTDKWSQTRWDVLARADRAAARYRAETMPIPLRAADVHLRETDTRNEFVLACSLAAGRSGRGKQWSIPIRAKDQRQYRDLHAIITGERKLGALSIKRDRNGRNWSLRISYKQQVVRQTGTRLAAINRGICCLLAIVTEDGDRLIYEGAEVEAYLAQMHARRRRIQNGYPLSGRKGRGRGHALAAIARLEGKATRWRATRLQTIAREAQRWLSARGVTQVLVDDLKGIRDGAADLLDGGKPVWERIQQWPYFEMGQRLTSCLDEAGITHSTRPCDFGSRTCPACGWIDPARGARRRFTCDACKFSDHVDVTLGRNLINREQTGGAIRN